MYNISTMTSVKNHANEKGDGGWRKDRDKLREEKESEIDLQAERQTDRYRSKYETILDLNLDHQ